METREFGEFQMLLSKLPEGAGVDGELLKHYTNTVVDDIVRSYEWRRLNKTSLLQTKVQYSTGTVSVAFGATAGTGTGTAFTAPMTGRRIRFASTAAFYTFTFVGAGSFTIDRAYEDETDVVDGAFRIWEPIYTLPALTKRVKSIEVPSRGWDLQEKDREWLNRRDSERRLYGDPQVYVPFDDSSAGLQRVELYPGPENAEGLPLEYLAKLDPLVDTDDTFPDWFPIPALWAGCVAMLNGRPLQQETLYLKALESAQNEEHKGKPAISIDMEDRFIEHRVRRAQRNRHRGSGGMW